MNSEKLQQVKLLIFDFDGTLFNSVKVNHYCINRALVEMEFLYKVDEKTIKSHLGEQSEAFYSHVLPGEVIPFWHEIRQKNRKFYNDFVYMYGSTFPNVKETLTELKNRNIKLAVYSNCSPDYLNHGLNALRLTENFDYVECSKENNLQKNELARKICNKFNQTCAAVIGDKIHDVEAARSNGFISIGALYGYGAQEVSEADYAITQFSDLLDLFQ